MSAGQDRKQLKRDPPYLCALQPTLTVAHYRFTLRTVQAFLQLFTLKQAGASRSPRRSVGPTAAMSLFGRRPTQASPSPSACPPLRTSQAQQHHHSHNGMRMGSHARQQTMRSSGKAASEAQWTCQASGPSGCSRWTVPVTAGRLHAQSVIRVPWFSHVWPPLLPAALSRALFSPACSRATATWSTAWSPTPGSRWCWPPQVWRHVKVAVSTAPFCFSNRCPEMQHPLPFKACSHFLLLNFGC